MGFFNNFPYTNFHELNLQWVLEEMLKLGNAFSAFTAVNTVKYGGIWSATKSYTKWTIVTTENESYISLKDVPVGVDIENNDYWLKVADLDPRIAALETEITEINTLIEKLENKFDSIPFFFVTNYGAKGDGIADDTNAIQSCIDAAMEKGGGAVLLPSGTYNISGSLVIRPHTASVDTGGNQDIHFIKMDRLEFVGLGDCIIKAVASMDKMIYTYDYSYPDNVGSFSNFYTLIENVFFDGNGKAKQAIHLDHALHSRPQNCQIDRVDVGIYARGYGDLKIENNAIRANVACVSLDSAGDNLIQGNDFYLSDTGIGVLLTGFAGSTVVNRNTFTPTNMEDVNAQIDCTGIKMQPGVWSGNPAFCTSVRICNNSFDAITTGVYAVSDGSVYVGDINVYSNKCANSYGHKTNLFKGEKVYNCIIHDNVAGAGYEAFGASGYLAILESCGSCIIENNLTRNTDVIPVVLKNCLVCRINGNTFIDSCIGNTGGCCVLIEGDSYRNDVDGNMFTHSRDDSATTAIRENGNAGFSTGSNNFNGFTTEYDYSNLTSRWVNIKTGYSAPTEGAHKVGEVVFNLTEDSTVVGWKCTKSGTPGTWTAFNGT